MKTSAATPTPRFNTLALAAGFGERLRPWTDRTPKPLLPVGGAPVIELLLQQLISLRARGLSRIGAVVTSRHAAAFRQWQDELSVNLHSPTIEWLDNGVTSPEERRGAVADLWHAIERLGFMDQALLVVAADTVFGGGLDDFVTRAQASPCACTCALHLMDELETVKSLAEVRVNGDGIIRHYIEKPVDPRSLLASIALYWFQPPALPMIGEYLGEGGAPDPAGRLFEWLKDRIDTAGIEVAGPWFDIGSEPSWRAADSWIAAKAAGKQSGTTDDTD